MGSRRWLGLLATSFVLVACAGQTRVYNAQLSPAYGPTEYGYGAGRRDLTTVIRGDPFQLGEEPFQARFVEVLNRHQPFMQPTHFTTTPGPSARPMYRAVFVFNAPVVSPTQLCRRPLSVPMVDTGPTVLVNAAFCRWQGYLSTVTGEVEVDSMDDPQFDRLIGQLILMLFPPIDPTDDDGRRWLVARLAEAARPAVRTSALPAAVRRIPLVAGDA